ncbi:MAG: glycoside hydrolase family 99-like domain-containing protein [Bacteroidota bacterium]
MLDQKAIILAHYLPQYHPIAENNQWWGTGFTEWTNTVKAKPLYRGHLQPNLPADLGLYDLRVPEVRTLQADLAKKHGITGFAYWHYWFGNGRKILERPFNEVLQSGCPDLPFCLAWANESWTGIWHGLKDEILMEQTYPGEADYILHFNHLLPSFNDKRYIKIDNRPLFLIYLPQFLPDATYFTKLWNDLALQNGFNGMYFIGTFTMDWDHKQEGFDEKSVHPLPHYIEMFESSSTRKLKNKITNFVLQRLKTTYNYSDLVKNYKYEWLDTYDFVPSILPNWDNTPRSGRNGYVVHGSNPVLFHDHIKLILQTVLKQTTNRNNIILLKSWNEWAEGNYLEPDSRWGLGYLEAIRDVLQELCIDSTYKLE